MGLLRQILPSAVCVENRPGVSTETQLKCQATLRRRWKKPNQN